MDFIVKKIIQTTILNICIYIHICFKPSQNGLFPHRIHTTIQNIVLEALSRKTCAFDTRNKLKHVCCFVSIERGAHMDAQIDEFLHDDSG